MHLIIPMAGKGKRMRPHTLTTPKPLMPIVGKPIVARLMEEIQAACPLSIDTIGFVVNELEPDTQAQLTELAQDLGAQAQFYLQHDALGTAHAVLCAATLLQGPVIVAFADTLFKSQFTLDKNQESVIWVKKVQDPSAFGVTQLDDQGKVTAFVEKPEKFVSDLAIIGIYYFQEGAQLHQALQSLVEQGIQRNGEYELTAALEAMKQKGVRFATQTVEEWLDCGNKDATLYTNQRFLTFLQDNKDLVAPTARLENSVLIPPVYVGEEVVLKNTVLGPHVSVGSHTRISDTRMQNSIVQTHSTIENTIVKDSIIGNHVYFSGNSAAVNIGDYTTIKHDD